MKKKKLTRRDIVDKQLKKYEVDLNKVDYQKLKEFKEHMKELTDQRMPKKCTYKIWDIVVVVFIAVLANCNEWEEIENFAKLKKQWFKNFLKLFLVPKHMKEYFLLLILKNWKKQQHILFPKWYIYLIMIKI